MNEQQNTPSSRIERLYDLKHLKPDFILYLDALIGNVLTTGGYGKIEIEINNFKVDRVWVGPTGKAGYQF